MNVSYNYATLIGFMFYWSYVGGKSTKPVFKDIKLAVTNLFYSILSDSGYAPLNADFTGNITCFR